MTISLFVSTPSTPRLREGILHQSCVGPAQHRVDDSGIEIGPLGERCPASPPLREASSENGGWHCGVGPVHRA